MNLDALVVRHVFRVNGSVCHPIIGGRESVVQHDAIVVDDPPQARVGYDEVHVDGLDVGFINRDINHVLDICAARSRPEQCVLIVVAGEEIAVNGVQGIESPKAVDRSLERVLDSVPMWAAIVHMHDLAANVRESELLPVAIVDHLCTWFVKM